MSDNDEVLRLREELRELRNQVAERHYEYASKHGFAEGWRTGIDVRIDRLEKKLDDLLFSLIDWQRRTASSDTGQEGKREEKKETPE